MAASPRGLLDAHERPVLTEIANAPPAPPTPIRTALAVAPDSAGTMTDTFELPAATSPAIVQSGAGTPLPTPSQASLFTSHTDNVTLAQFKSNPAVALAVQDKLSERKKRAVEQRKALQERVVAETQEANAAEERGDLDTAIQIYHKVASLCLDAMPTLNPKDATIVLDYMKTIGERIAVLHATLFEASVLEESTEVSQAADDRPADDSRFWFTGINQSSSSRDLPSTVETVRNPKPPAAAPEPPGSGRPSFSLSAAPPRPTTTSLSTEQLSHIKEREEELKFCINTINLDTKPGTSQTRLVLKLLTTRGVQLLNNYVKLEPLSSAKRAEYENDMLTCLLPMEDMSSWQTSRLISTESLLLRHEYYPALKKLDFKFRRILDSFYIVKNFVSWSEIWQTGRRREDGIWRPISLPSVNQAPFIEFIQKSREELGGVNSKCSDVCRRAVEAMRISKGYLENLPKSCRATVSPEVAKMLRASAKFDIVEFMKRQPNGWGPFQAKKMVSDLENYLLVFELKSAEAAANQRLRQDPSRRQDRPKRRALEAIAVLRREWPGMGSTKLEESKIGTNEDLVLAYLEAYSRMVEGLAYKVLRVVEVVHAEITK